MKLSTVANNTQPLTQDRIRIWILLIAAGTLASEIFRLKDLLAVDAGFSIWLTRWHPESTAPLLCLLALGFLKGRKESAHRTDSPHKPGRLASLAAMLVIFATSVACSWSIGSRPVEIKLPYKKLTSTVAELPPAYHDEYSYLLQANTFRNGRLSYPPVEIAADEFHQFHVLNERRTVSRYFPGTGLWLAIFSEASHPFWAQWIAGGLASVLFFLAVKETCSLLVAFIAGMLIAVSPGMALFGNLLLAHHLTLLTISLFVLAYFRGWRHQNLAWMFVAGGGLSLAMLSRPMTAAGFALPFGLHLLAHLRKHRFARKACFGFAIPLAVAFGFLAILNHDATGSVWKTAYQQYTDLFTPRHRFGFDNGSEPLSAKGPPAVRKYDQWAADLTWSKAAMNGSTRLRYTAIWSIGIVPAVCFGLLGIVALVRATNAKEHDDRPRWLLPCSLISLHVAHLAYWYDGIMHWHYVFESGPMLLIACAVGIDRVCATRQRVKLATALCSLLIFFSLAGRWASWDLFLPTENTVSVQLSQQLFSRQRIAIFRELVEQKRENRPALVFVDERDSDPQLSYIINPPDYEGDVLVCRLPESETAFHDIKDHYRDRKPLLFDPQSMTVREINSERVPEF